jgi:hypothetical protein
LASDAVANFQCAKRLRFDFLPSKNWGTIKHLIGLTTDQALDRTQFLLNLYCLDATEMVWLQM